MTLSTRSIWRGLQLSFALVLMAGILVPAVASAGEFDDGSSDEGLSVIVQSDLDVALVNAEANSCVLSDPSKGDHHEKDSWAERAEEWETGARKHAKAGDHKEAGGAYEQAGCNWERAANLEKAIEAYENAADQYKEAGEDDLAAAARKKARELRKSLR